MEFRKNILLMLMSCIDRPSREDLSTDEDMADIFARLRARRMAEVKEIVQIFDPDDSGKVVRYSYDKFIEIYDNYGLGGFFFFLIKRYFENI